MLPDIGATELLVIAVVALIVVGPKDLPMLLRRLGQFMAKLRGMAAEFRASFDEMARQSELDELRKEVEAMRRGEFAGAPSTEVNQAFEDINQSLTDVGVQLHPPMSHQWDATTPEVEPEVAPIPAAPPKKPRARKAAAPKATAPKAADVAAPKTPAAPRKPRAKKIVEGGS